MEKSGNWALITGASMGLGRAIAEECAARGMNILLVALPGSGLPELGASIERDAGVSVLWLEADLTESETMARLLYMIRGEGIEVSLLVNNAGIGSVGPFMAAPLEEHEAVIALNILAIVRLTRLVLAESGAGGRRRVLNVASLGSFYPMPGLSVYAATKGFVFDLSLALRAELAGKVGVSVLCPNAIRTTKAVDDYLARFGILARLACMSPEAVARIALDGVERGRAVIVPGLFNRALSAASRFAPRALAMSVIGRCWGGFGACPDSEAEVEGSGAA